jgi:hypothetical protein
VETVGIDGKGNVVAANGGNATWRKNPIINSRFHEPTRHFRFSDEGVTNEDKGRATTFRTSDPCLRRGGELL